MARSLKGLVGLVTGGAGWLGSVTIQHLLAANCRVASLDVISPSDYHQKFDATADQLILQEGNTVSECDVKQCLDAIRSKFGQLDFVVNCAGRGGAIRFVMPDAQSLTPKTYSLFIENNTTGVFNVCRLAAPLIAEKEIKGWGETGIIINVSSNFAYEGNINQVSYASSKAAVRAMTLPLARDLAQQKIRVVCVSPGLFETDTVFKSSFKDNSFAYRYIESLNLTNKKGLLPCKGFAETIEGIILNPMLNGCNVRVDDGARVIFL